MPLVRPRGAEPPEARAAARRQLGPLHRLRVGEKTYAKYLAAASHFPQHRVMSLFIKLAPTLSICRRRAMVATWQATTFVRLPWTKRRQRREARERWTLDDPFLGRLLKVVANRQLPQNLICPSGDRQLRLFFQRANAQLGFAASFYKPYSLRRGGATHDYMSNKNLAKTILRGRWSELKTARLYINDGLAQ